MRPSWRSAREQVQVGQREIARFLHGDVAAQHEATSPFDADALEERAHRAREAHEQADGAPDLVEVELPRHETDLAARTFAEVFAETWRVVLVVGAEGLVDAPPEQTSETVEAVVPIVVARYPENDALS